MGGLLSASTESLTEPSGAEEVVPFLRGSGPVFVMWGGRGRIGHDLTVS
jgi:hypothetical protein